TADLDVLATTDIDLDRPSIVGGASASPLAHNLLPAARDHALGGVTTTARRRQDPAARALPGLRDGLARASLAVIGPPPNATTTASWSRRSRRTASASSSGAGSAPSATSPARRSTCSAPARSTELAMPV